MGKVIKMNKPYIASILQSLKESASNLNHIEAIKDAEYALSLANENSCTALVDHIFIWRHSTDYDSVDDAEYKQMINVNKNELKGGLYDEKI